MAGLFGMPGIALPDRDTVQKPGGTGFVAPDPRDIGDAGVSQILLEHCRAQNGAVTGHFVGSLTHRRNAKNDGIIPKIKGFHFKNRFRIAPAGIIAGPFAERSLIQDLARMKVAFEHDLGVRGKRKTSDFSLHTFDRFAADAADNIEFKHANGGLGASVEEGNRFAANNHGDRAGFTACPVFLPVNVAVLACDHQATHRFAIVKHGPVGTAIEPPVIRVPGHGIGAGAQIAAAVIGVPKGCWKRHQIDVVPGLDVFEDRTIGNDHMRNGFALEDKGFETGI